MSQSAGHMPHELHAMHARMPVTGNFKPTTAIRHWPEATGQMVDKACGECMQAERRQQKFDTSATGRAARTAVNNVKKERDAERVDRNDRAKDWLN